MKNFIIWFVASMIILIGASTFTAVQIRDGIVNGAKKTVCEMLDPDFLTQEARTFCAEAGK